MAKQSRKKQKKKAEQIYSGFEQLAFGQITDAIRLIYSDNAPSIEEIENMDLLNISEIKRAKGGGMEIKFFDRLKALEKMQSLNEEESDNSSNSFYEALMGTVKSSSNRRDDEDE
ncbi:MAG: hypothetical protein K5917_00385 [Clostridiales bacterium]|nr:hypothetical protein [Clostridiales bacterium]